MLCGNLEEVLVQNRQVRIITGDQVAAMILFAGHSRDVAGENAQRLLGR